MNNSIETLYEILYNSKNSQGEMMANNSKIEWTETTWNPVTGCTKISKGCLNCYAERLSARLREMGQPKYKNGFKITLHPQELGKPLTWAKPRIIFVNSMSDLFHEEIPLTFIKNVFDTMTLASRHVFQILTKRSKRLAELAPQLKWTENIMMGVTVEAEEYSYRIHDLIRTPAKHKFLSLEPLLTSIPHIQLNDIDWVIVGGESGPNFRDVDGDWIKDIKKQCNKAKVPFFFKQWGGINKKKNGRLLDGKIWSEVPAVISQGVSTKQLSF